METIFAYFREELSVALLSSKQADEQDACAIYCEESANRIELGREDLKYDECERELADGRSDVRPLERTLRCANLYHLSGRQDH